MKFNHLNDATAVAEEIKAGRLTPVEAVEEAIRQIKEYNEDYQAVIHLYEAKALEAARQLTDFSTPFAGVPILLKDAGQDLAGYPSTSGSKLLKDNLAKQTSNFVEDVLAAGFIVVGHTNVPEFAIKYVSDSAYFGSVANPVNPAHHAGGSSGGAATALQLGMVPIVTASDGGGSIRIPASFSGLIGLKPTRGKIATGPGRYRSWGGAAVHFSLTKTMRDTLNFLLATQRPDQEAKPFMSPALTEAAVMAAIPEVKDLRLAYTTESFCGGAVSEAAVAAVEETVAKLRELGFQVEAAHPPIDGQGLLAGYFEMNAAETYKVFNAMEASMGRPIQRGEVEDSSLALAEYGRRIPAWRYSATLDDWDRASQIMADFHQDYDLLIQPATAKPAPRLDQQVLRTDLLEGIEDFAAMETEALGQLVAQVFQPGSDYSPFAFVYNLTGQPALSLPLYTTADGLPLGVMFSSLKHREDLLLGLGFYLEQADFFEYYDD